MYKYPHSWVGLLAVMEGLKLFFLWNDFRSLFFITFFWQIVGLYKFWRTSVMQQQLRNLEQKLSQTR